MDNKARKDILVLLEQMKQTQEYITYQNSYQELMENQKALLSIADYKVAKADYAELILNVVHSDEKLTLQKELFLKKQQMNQYPIINEYFLSARKIELFIDDLNYEINHLVGKGKKHSCHK